MEDYRKYCRNVKYTPDKISLKEKPICNNSHELKSIGGSMNGRKDGNYATVFMCVNCERYGYSEDFKNNFENIKN